MYSGELEVQAKRKAIAVLQDEINRILNAARELQKLPELMIKKDKIRKEYGLALRFPKFTGKIRVEKAVEDASTNEEVITLYKGQNKVAHDKNLI